MVVKVLWAKIERRAIEVRNAETDMEATPWLVRQLPDFLPAHSLHGSPDERLCFFRLTQNLLEAVNVKVLDR